jgi:PAS domain S-box-containing protein
MIGIAVDVSSSKAAQSILQESEKNFRSIVEQAPHGIYRADAQGKLLLVNPAFVKMLGYDSKEEVLALNIGKDVYRYPEQRADLVAQALQNGRFSDIEIEMRCKNGSAIIVRANGLPVYDQRGELEAFQVIVEDVTKSKTLERQFWQAQKLEAVGRLAGGVAHDFNNTLMIVSSYADLILQRDCGDSKTLSYAEQIHRAALKASSVTQQLLAFSRKQILEPEVLDTDTVLKDLGKMLPKLLGEDITLVIEPHSTGCHVKADRGQLEQIIMNLVVNARDAMPSGGRLLIRSQGIEVDSAFAAEHPPTVPGRYVLLTVTDTGLGMDTETRARIFEPFFTTKERGKGTGLGLATVYGIVKQSGGFIWVTSEPGAGTTFDIYLPQVPDALTPAAKPYGAKNSVRGSENILLVEDEVALLEATREFLEFSGYSVISANSGAEALRAAQEQDGNIDLLVTDVVMPELDGVELASCLRAKFPALKVLYMSGYADRALQDNLDRKMLLRKPFSQELLAVKIREALSSRTETKS